MDDKLNVGDLLRIGYSDGARHYVSVNEVADDESYYIVSNPDVTFKIEKCNGVIPYERVRILSIFETLIKDVVCLKLNDETEEFEPCIDIDEIIKI